MRYRKKLAKGLSISLGKKKSSVNVGGFNIPIKGNAKSPTDSNGSNEGCLNAFAIFGGLFILFCIGVYIFGPDKKEPNPIIMDSTMVKDTIKKSIHHRRHPKKHKNKTYRGVFSIDSIEKSDSLLK